MTTKSQNKTQAARRMYGYTDKQIKALKSTFGENWSKLGKNALDAALYTMGLKSTALTYYRNTLKRNVTIPED